MWLSPFVPQMSSRFINKLASAARAAAIASLGNSPGVATVAAPAHPGRELPVQLALSVVSKAVTDRVSRDSGIAHVVHAVASDRLAPMTYRQSVEKSMQVCDGRHVHERVAIHALHRGIYSLDFQQGCTFPCSTCEPLIAATACDCA